MPKSAIARAALVLTLGLILLIGGVVLWRLDTLRSAGEPVETAGSESGSGEVQIGGPFELVNQDGETVTAADFEGQYMLVYFGYTYCPDICPTSLLAMTQGLDHLEEEAPAKAEQVQPIFITVDPERDTVAVMKDYAQHFHPRLRALTGTPEQIKAAADAYRIYYRKAEQEGGDYLMDHSGFLYLMGPDGHYVTHFGHDATPEEIAKALATNIPGA